MSSMCRRDHGQLWIVVLPTFGQDFGALPYGEFRGVVGWEGAVERPVHQGSVGVQPGNPGGRSV